MAAKGLEVRRLFNRVYITYLPSAALKGPILLAQVGKQFLSLTTGTIMGCL
jgi:hypothetical protein